MRSVHRWLPLVAGLLLLAGCADNEPPPPKPQPQSLTREAVGHYCQMIVADHQGPKAQLYLDSRADPYWFSSVRDAVAFTRLPEEPKNIAAIYVNDMTSTPWERPGDDTWLDALNAWFVIGSDHVGGMGAPEVVPFASAAAAAAFAKSHGGRVVRLGEIPDGYVLGEVATPQSSESGHAMPAGGMDHGKQH